MPKEVAVVSALFCSLALPSSVCLGQTAQERPGEYTIALAQSGVPVGLVAPRDVLIGRHAVPHSETMAAGTSISREGLASSLDLFNTAKGGFRARQEGGVVHVRSLEEPAEVGSALERSTLMEEAVEVPAFGAIYRYVVRAMSGVEPPQGFVFSGALPGPECPINRPVRMPEGSLSAIALLDQIVRQVPGLVWVVSYSPEAPNAGLKVGRMCPDGEFVRTEVYR